MSKLAHLKCRNAKFSAKKAVGLTMSVGILGLLAANEAGAACATFKSPAGFANSGMFKPAVYRPEDQDANAYLAINFDDYRHVSIVGLWKVEFLAKGNSNGIPDGALIDFGTATWYGDGTETMISGGRQPSDGDVCMGAWEQTGRNTYKLNHLAMGYEGGVYVGPTSVLETVTLDPSGKSFHGNFTITAYLATAIPGHEFDENTILPPTPIRGTITGVRITAN